MQSKQGTTANLQYAMTLSTAGPEIQALVPEIRNADKDLTLGWSQTRLPDLDKKCVPFRAHVISDMQGSSAASGSGQCPSSCHRTAWPYVVPICHLWANG